MINKLKALIKINQNIVCLTGLLLAFGQSIVFADEQDIAKSVCGGCHGVKGISTQATIPNLAGQKAGYLVQQIKAMKNGSRKNDQMVAIVKNLTDAQIVNLAEYFSNQQPMKVGAATENQLGKNVRATCISCHGINGVTVNEEWPNLGGQKKAYLQKQLMAFRDGSQNNPIMKVIANELTEEQIEAVAEYYSQIPGG